jgi:hypothetical protein
MLTNDNHKPFTSRERKILELATIGGLTEKEAFWKVYRPKDEKTGLSSFSRKRKNRPELFAEIARYNKELFDAAAEAQREALKAKAAANALTAIEKRESLRKIIEGETEEEIIFQHLGKALKVKRAPSLSDRIRAIDLDNKMAGHYAPVKMNHEGGDQFLEALKALSGKRLEMNERGDVMTNRSLGYQESIQTQNDGSSSDTTTNSSLEN